MDLEEQETIEPEKMSLEELEAAELKLLAEKKETEDSLMRLDLEDNALSKRIKELGIERNSIKEGHLKGEAVLRKCKYFLKIISPFKWRKIKGE